MGRGLHHNIKRNSSLQMFVNNKQSKLRQTNKDEMKEEN